MKPKISVFVLVSMMINGLPATASATATVNEAPNSAASLQVPGAKTGPDQDAPSAKDEAMTPTTMTLLPSGPMGLGAPLPVLSAAAGGALGAAVGVGLVAGFTAGFFALAPSSDYGFFLAGAALLAVPLVPALGALLSGLFFVGARGELTGVDTQAALTVSGAAYACTIIAPCMPCMCAGMLHPVGWIEIPLFISKVAAASEALFAHSASPAFAPAIGAAIGGVGLVAFGVGGPLLRPNASTADFLEMAALGGTIAVVGAALGGTLGGLAAP